MFGWLGNLGRAAKRARARVAAQNLPASHKRIGASAYRRAMEEGVRPPSAMSAARRAILQSATGKGLGKQVVIGHPKANTRKVCGCKLVSMKKGRKAVKCPNAGPKGGAMFRFVGKADAARAARAKNLCAFIAKLAPPKHGRRKGFSFKSRAGVPFKLGRKPSFKQMKAMTAAYYKAMDKRARKAGRGIPTRRPSFAGWDF